MSQRRNALCGCGSGKKFKHCCGSEKPKQAPQDLKGLFAAAQRAHGEGRLLDAGAIYEEILRRDPNYVDAIHYLGMTAFQQGDCARAKVLVLNSLSLQPEDGDYWSNLGVISEATGEMDQAAVAYNKATECSPKKSQFWFNLGNVLQRLGQLDESESKLRQAVAISPSNWQCWMSLGVTLLSRDGHGDEDAEAALQCFERVVRLDPSNGDGYNSLGVTMIRLGKKLEAEEMINRAVQLKPNLDSAWHNLARIYIEEDDINRALLAYQKAIEISPNYGSFHVATGQALRMQGKFDLAQQFFERAYELNPKDLGVLAQLLSDQKFTNAEVPLLVKAQASIDSASDSETGLVEMCFSLGKILDRLGEFDKAFAYYKRGNEIENSKNKYDAIAHENEVQRIINIYSSDYFKSIGNHGNDSCRPILIVGMPRSGTTLTEQIIASHPEVAGGGERLYWSEVADRIKGRERDLLQSDFSEIAQACLADLNSAVGARNVSKVTDKLPGNYLRVGLIHSIFPNAKIIHVKRNGIDNCLSIYFQRFGGYHPYAYDLVNLAHYRAQYERLMAHWSNVMSPEYYMEFDYEELVGDLEGIGKRIIEFCGLEWDERCLRYYESGRAVKTASIWQVRQKIYNSSVDRWKHYEKFIEPLLAMCRVLDD